MNAHLDDGWWIPHPGTLEWTRCDSFLDAMNRWFEGFNTPRRVVNGVMEDFHSAHERVSRYYTGATVVDLFTPAEPEYQI